MYLHGYKVKELLDDIKHLVTLSEHSNGNREIKDFYLKLVRKYHPDSQKSNFDIYNKCMAQINLVYSQLQTNKYITNNSFSEYNDYFINGKYKYRNHYGIEEQVSDLELFVYKLGFSELQKAQRIIIDNSVLFSKEDPLITQQAIQCLNNAITHFTYVINMNKSLNWVNESKAKIRWAYEINLRITKQNIKNINMPILK